MPEPRRPSEPAEVQAWLEEAGVNAVVLGFVDPSMIVRAKVVPIRRFAAAATAGVGLSTLFNAAMSNDQFALLAGYIDGPSGDLRLRADASATVPLAALPGWAWAPVDQFQQDGQPFAACPRAFARRMAEAYLSRGLSVRAAFEFEFSVGIRRDDGGFEPAHEGPGYSDIALVRNHEFALDLLTTMEAQGLDLQQLHPEYADGQFEMSIGPREPVAAADAAMVVRQTARAVARRHGLVVSFAPQVAADTGNGTHLHVSLWEGERNLLAGGGGASGHAATGRGVHRRHPRRAAGDRGRHGADHGGLPPAAAASLVGRDAVLGAGEPRGRAPVRRRRHPRDRGRRQRGGQTGRRHREPLPGGRAPCWPPGCTGWMRATGCRPPPRRTPRACPTT